MPLMPLKRKTRPVILLDPAGKQFDQAYAEDLPRKRNLILICGHYGCDEEHKTLVTDEDFPRRLCLDWWRISSHDHD